MAAFRQLDFFALDGELSEEEKMVRDTVRSWVSERFLPTVAEHFEAGTFPHELTPELAELGVFGSNLPEEYGCAAGDGKRRISYKSQRELEVAWLGPAA